MNVRSQRITMSKFKIKLKLHKMSNIWIIITYLLILNILIISDELFKSITSAN